MPSPGFLRGAFIAVPRAVVGWAKARQRRAHAFLLGVRRGHAAFAALPTLRISPSSWPSRSLLQFLAQQVEALERRAVGHDEQACVTILRGVAGEAPVRDREHVVLRPVEGVLAEDRKSTRLNSSHGYISYAVFCLKKKNHSE